MRRALTPVAALLLSVAILLMGNGLQSTLLPIRARIEAFSTLDIGAMGSAYFVGFAAGCLLGPWAVRRVGHIRAFAAMVSIAASVALVHVLIVQPTIWWLLRALTGFCFATLYMIIESWLNERASNETRGLIFSVYTIINLTVLTLGQLMITLDDPASFTLFCLASILVSVAAVPVALTTAQAPARIDRVRLRMGRLYRSSPVGFVGCLAVGLANGSFWSLGPVFAQDLGMDVTGVAYFMGLTVIAGAIGQWPLGRASDLVDRRKIIVATCLAAALSGIAMVLIEQAWQGGLFIAAFFFGVFAFPVYALAVAHTNDFVAPQDYVETASGLLLVYGLGAVVGPIAASSLMAATDPRGLFAFTALVHGTVALFVLARMKKRARAPSQERGEFTEALLAAQTVAPMAPATTVDEDQEATSTGRAE